MNDYHRKMETFITNVLEIPYDNNTLQNLITEQDLLEYSENELFCVLLKINSQKIDILQTSTKTQNMELRRRMISKKSDRLVLVYLIDVWERIHGNTYLGNGPEWNSFCSKFGNLLMR